MRAFLAVAPDAQLSKQLAHVQQTLKAAVDSLRSTAIKVTWTKLDTIHLTFRFFANLDEQVVEPMRDAVANVTSTLQPVEIPLSRLGAFPRPQAPRVLWLGPPAEWEQSQDAAQLAAVMGAIDEACAQLAIARDEKPWRPHLTLARVREGERHLGPAIAAALAKPAPVGALHVDAISLIKSEATSGGHLHTKLWTTGLRGGWLEA